jgi:hypothetical protein
MGIDKDHGTGPIGDYEKKDDNGKPPTGQAVRSSSFSLSSVLGISDGGLQDTLKRELLTKKPDSCQAKRRELGPAGRRVVIKQIV